MKALLLVLGLCVSASASGLEEAWTGAAVPFEGASAVPGAPAVDARGGWAPATPALSAAVPAAHRRRRTFDDGFMDGFGFVETPAVAVIDANMSCRYGLCSGNPAVGAFGYGLGLLLMPLACVAGLVTAGWWAVFG